MKSLAFGIGLICVVMGIIGMPYLNYVYFFQPERRGSSGDMALIVLNVLCILDLVFGVYLIKFGAKQR